MNDTIKTKRLRAMIGWLGMLLPWIVVLLVGGFPSSISATWYTNACTPFMIILGSAGILLICYHGYDLVDDILNTAAGIFGLGICLFPCWGGGHKAEDLVGTFLIKTELSNTIHSICALIFFAILAYNSLFQFTKGNSGTKNKKIRNVIYRICGVGMLASFAILLLPDFRIQVWLTEAIALFFFGLSWLTKADKYPWLFCDKD